jgi:hypothetical protein
MMRLARLATLALALAATFTACRPKAPVEPVPPPPPRIVAVQPPARSAGYAYDGQIWALFDRALDPQSIDTTTVFLKKDTQRLACAVSYEPTSRRIVVVPRLSLAINTTYTVIITGLVKARDGVPLGADFLWQFSTSSVRRVTYLYPTLSELASPVAMLRWASLDAIPGTLRYDVYVGQDSVEVHARRVPILTTTSNSYYLPRAYWASGRRTYWAVTTTNTSTGERLDSPVAAFDVLPAGRPTRVVSGQAIEWGGIQLGRPNQFCTSSSLTLGAGYNAAMRFDIDPARMGRRVLSARLVMHASSNAAYIPYAYVWSCTPGWAACGMVYPGPPYLDPSGNLGNAHLGLSSTEMVFDSVALAAWVEGMLRGGDFSGLMFTLSQNTLMSISTTQVAYPRPSLVVTVLD